MEILERVEVIITNILDALGLFGPLLGCFLICIESIIPILPLSVFVTLNFLAFGNILGFLISYVCTIIGCLISYSLVRLKIKASFENFANKKDRKTLNKLINIFNNIKLENLCVLFAIPFAPAFLINIAAGLTNVSKKKFLIALFIGKIFFVYFWGYVGVTFMESLSHPVYFLRIIIISSIAYIISRIVNKMVGVE